MAAVRGNQDLISMVSFPVPGYGHSEDYKSEEYEHFSHIKFDEISNEILKTLPKTIESSLFSYFSTEGSGDGSEEESTCWDDIPDDVQQYLQVALVYLNNAVSFVPTPDDDPAVMTQLWKRCLSMACVAVGSLPEKLEHTFPRIPWGSFRAIRNYAVHCHSHEGNIAVFEDENILTNLRPELSRIRDIFMYPTVCTAPMGNWPGITELHQFYSDFDESKKISSVQYFKNILHEVGFLYPQFGILEHHAKHPIYKKIFRLLTIDPQGAPYQSALVQSYVQVAQFFKDLKIKIMRGDKLLRNKLGHLELCITSTGCAEILVKFFEELFRRREELINTLHFYQFYNSLNREEKDNFEENIVSGPRSEAFAARFFPLATFREDGFDTFCNAITDVDVIIMAKNKQWSALSKLLSKVENRTRLDLDVQDQEGNSLLLLALKEYLCGPSNKPAANVVISCCLEHAIFDAPNRRGESARGVMKNQLDFGKRSYLFGKMCEEDARAVKCGGLHGAGLEAYIKLLLPSDVDAPLRPDGMAALHIAHQKGAKIIVRFLEDRMGADPRVRCKKGWTPGCYCGKRRLRDPSPERQLIGLKADVTQV